MAWSFPIGRFDALPENREQSPDGFSIPGRATPLMLMKSGATSFYLAHTPKSDFEHLYWACSRYGDPIQLDPEEVESQMIAGAQRGLPARPNAITFLNRILKLPEHLAPRIISHVENSSIKTIYADNLDLGKSLRSAYRTMGHSVQRELEISFMARQIATTSAGSSYDEMMKGFHAKNPSAWVDEAIRRGNVLRKERRAAEQEANFSANDFGYA